MIAEEIRTIEIMPCTFHWNSRKDPFRGCQELIKTPGV